MSMTARLWSINALATELGTDRRTIGTRLRRTRPDGELNGHAAWTLPTALKAINGEGGGKTDRGPPPPGAEMLADVRDPVSMGFAIGHLDTVYRMPLLVASIGVGLGLSMADVFKLANALTVGLMYRAEEIARKSRLEPWATSPKSVAYNTGAFLPIAWDALREAAGEPDWTPPRPAPGWSDHPSE